jgi:F420-dependent oxidoreductase-like protein
MRIGLFFGDTGNIDALLGQVVAAEREGFASAWLPQIFGGDALTLLALAGKQTSAIELGTSVVPVYTRHPHIMAQQALTVQAASGGRFALGVGLSHAPVVEGMWGMSYEHPARYMREYLSVLRPLLHEGKVKFEGEVFRVNATVQIADAPPPELLVAALAPVMLKTAGELAEGTITWMTGPRTIETHVAPRITKSASDAGHPPPRIVCALPVCVTGDAAAARERAAQLFQVYGFLPNYKRMLEKEGAEGPKDVVIVGDEAEVERQIRALASAGATDFVAAEFPSGDDSAASLARTRALLKGLL